MARYTFAVTSVTPTATADAADLADNTYMGFLQGGGSTMAIKVSEIYCGGEAPSTSAPTIVVFGRDSQIATGAITVGTLGHTPALVDGTATAPTTAPKVGTTAATNKPRRDAAGHLLHLSFNAYGGIVRWVARPGEEPSIYGVAASVGQCSLSAFTGGTPGPLSSHIVYEVV